MSSGRLLLIALLFLAQGCLAQENYAFRLVYFHGKVTLDQTQAIQGQLVDSTFKTLNIENGYAYVLTPKGHAMKLEEGRYKVSEIEEMIKKKLSPPHFTATGAVSRGVPPPLQFLGLDQHKGAENLLFDSLVLRWKGNRYNSAKVKPPYILRIETMFNDVLWESNLNDSSVRIFTAKFHEEIAIMIGVGKLLEKDSNRQLSSKKRKDKKKEVDDVFESYLPYLVIKFVPAEKMSAIQNDIAELVQAGPESNIFKILILDCNDLDLDAMAFLSGIANLDISPFDRDVKNYFGNIRKKYEFN